MRDFRSNPLVRRQPLIGAVLPTFDPMKTQSIARMSHLRQNFSMRAAADLGRSTKRAISGQFVTVHCAGTSSSARQAPISAGETSLRTTQVGIALR